MFTRIELHTWYHVIHVMLLFVAFVFDSALKESSGHKKWLHSETDQGTGESAMTRLSAMFPFHLALLTFFCSSHMTVGLFCHMALCVLFIAANAGSLCRGLVQGHPELGFRRALWFAEGTGRCLHRRDLCSGIHQPRWTPLVGQDSRGF